MQYFEIRIWSAPATLCSYVLLGWFLGLQNVRIPFLIVLITNISNISLDLLFVYYFKMQMEGVALASVISEYMGLTVAFLVSFKVIQKQKPFCSWNKIINFSKIKAMLRLNSHIFVRTWCLIFAFAFFTAQSARMGDLVLAAKAVLLNFQTFMAYALDGFAHAAEALVGKAVGAKNKTHYKQIILTSGLWSFGVASLFAILYFSAGEHIINLLTGLEHVRSLAYLYLPWLILEKSVEY